MLFNILPYSMASESARLLQEKLKVNNQAKRYRPDSPYVRRLQTNGYSAPDEKTVLVRWGNSPVPLASLPAQLPNLLTLNFTDLKPYINKKAFFERYQSFEHTPAFLTQLVDAQNFLNASTDTTGPVLVERQVLDGHSGEGIRLLGKNDAPSSDGKLWTRYIKKQREFRVHFVKAGQTTNDVFFHWAEKLLKKSEKDKECPNRYQVRNWQNGWIFATHVSNPIPNAVRNAANQFVLNEKTALDFGAIDIIYNNKTESAYILEVNTAPGIIGNTLKFYSDCFASFAAMHEWGSNKTKIKSIYSMEGVPAFLDELESDEDNDYEESEDDNF